MVQRYAHLAPEFQERAIAALEAYGQDKQVEANEEAVHSSENIGGTNGHTLDTPAQNAALDKLALKARNPKGSLGVSMVGAARIELATPPV